MTLGYNPETPGVCDFKIKETAAQREKRIQNELLKLPRVGHGQTAPDALNTTHLDIKGKSGTPIYIDRKVNLT